MIAPLKKIIHSAKNHRGFRRYFSNTSWMFGEQMLRMLAGLLVGVWVARYLGPEQFGLFNYAIAFASLFGSIAKLGLDGIVVRDLVQEPVLRNIYMGTAFWLKLVGALVMLFVVGLTTLFTNNDPTTNLYVFIIASGIIFQSFEVVDFYFQSQVLSKFVSLSKLTQLLISSLIKIYLVMIGADLNWFVIVSLVDQITLAISLYIAYRSQKIGNFFGYFDFALAKKMLKDSWPLMISGLVVTFYMRIDQVMIKEMLGDREVGLYSAAVRLSEVSYFIPLLICQSILPGIVNAKKISEELYYSRLQKLFSIMAGSSVAIAILTTFLSGWLVTIIYGDAYSEAVSVLTVHIWASVFVFLGVASNTWFLSENLQRYLFTNTTVGAILNILLNLILIPRYGINGAAIATVISYAVAGYFMNALFKATRKNFYRLTLALIGKT